MSTNEMKELRKEVIKIEDVTCRTGSFNEGCNNFSIITSKTATNNSNYGYDMHYSNTLKNHNTFENDNSLEYNGNNGNSTTKEGGHTRILLRPWLKKMLRDRCIEGLEWIDQGSSITNSIVYLSHLFIHHFSPPRPDHVQGAMEASQQEGLVHEALQRLSGLYSYSSARQHHQHLHLHPHSSL